MRVVVSFHGFGARDDAVLELPEGTTYLDLLEALDVPSETVVVFAEEEPVPEDAPLRPDAPVRLVRVISGGGPP